MVPPSANTSDYLPAPCRVSAATHAANLLVNVVLSFINLLVKIQRNISIYANLHLKIKCLELISQFNIIYKYLNVL